MQPELRRRVEALLGGRIAASSPVGGGYTPALRVTIVLDDGRRAFVKAGTDPLTSGWLHREWALYDAIRAPFQPAVLGWDPGDPPILMLEDLSNEAWPPPWDAARVAAVRTMLAQVHATPPPDGLPAAREAFGEDSGWREVARDPAPFLSLRLASRSWLDLALPRLLDAEAAGPLGGDALVHLDVRSDNLCLRPAGALLVDWNIASVGDPTLDVAFWLPSLHAEGGPPPETILADAPEAAALVAGFFAGRAGLPVIPTAPRVRTVQRAQLASALPWAARALGLPPPLGES
jgi:hypothetical protein